MNWKPWGGFTNWGGSADVEPEVLGPDILGDGDFENLSLGSVPTQDRTVGWNAWSSDKGSVVSDTPWGGMPEGSTRCIFLSSSDEDLESVEREIPVDASSRYKITLEVATRFLSKEAWVYYMLDGVYQGEMVNPTAAEEWQTFSVYFDTGATDETVVIRLFATSDSSSTYKYFDNVKVQKVV